MRQYIIASLAAASASLSMPAISADTSLTIQVPTQQTLTSLGFSNKPLGAMQFVDASGDNVLVLAKNKSSSVGKTDDESTRTVALSAKLFTRKGTSPFTLTWEIKDHVTCPLVDVSADFFSQGTQVTDLNKNGLAEVTVAYHMFCGGGLDPSTVKVIMREGAAKYAIRGESLLIVPSQEPSGGAFKEDGALKKADPAIQRHMGATWKSVYVQKM